MTRLQEKVHFIAISQLLPRLQLIEKNSKCSSHFFKNSKLGPKNKLFPNFLNILTLNILKYIILKEKVEKVFKCPIK
jgi:hypothetical protein